MENTYHRFQPASTPEQGNVELPPMISLHKHIPPFLSLPLEIRLQIYSLCFFQDVQKYSTRTRNVLSEDCWKGDYPNKFHEFDLLLVNHQIHNEAATLAYSAQRQHLIQSHQTYYLSPTQLNTKRSKKWTWELESQWVWQPSCRSVKALAALRLPKLGLAFRDPYRKGRKLNLITDDQADALKTFFRSLVYHLRQENVTESIDIYFQEHNPGHNPGSLQCIFGATQDLLVSRCFTRSRETQYEVIYLLDDFRSVGYSEFNLRIMGGKTRICHVSYLFRLIGSIFIILCGGRPFPHFETCLLNLELSYNRNTDFKIIQWMEAPESVGRRFPKDMVSRYSLHALKKLFGSRGGKWEDWHLGMLAQQ